MSSIYIQEPPTNGKVLLNTSLGDIDIELWSKEAPKACRNFVQLCMEGYYNETIFHRVEIGFIAQGGDPTGTGNGGESIYGKPFKDEYHQRLRFNRRGLVAMANAGADDNGSQFFFTLDRAEELDKKHTIFGKVTGNTLYNMIRFNDLDVDEDNRPCCPPKIIKTQVLSCPFDDVEPRTIKSVETDKGEKEIKKIKATSKATKNYKLLSFGEEAEEDEEESEQAAKGLQIKSSHDLLNDPKLSSIPAIDSAGREPGDVEGKLPTQKKAKIVDTGNVPLDSDEHEEEHEKVSKKKLKRKLSKKKMASAESECGEVLEEKTKKDEAVNDFVKELAQERQNFRKKQKTDSMLKKGGSRQDQTLALLASFENKLNSVVTKDEDEDEEKDEEKEEEKDEEKEPSADIKETSDVKSDSWMSHKLKFVEPADAAKDASMKGDDWYDIYDPRNPVNERRREVSRKDDK